MTTEPKKPKLELTNLTIKEGSVVDSGDNPEAHVMLMKRDQEISDGVWTRLKKWASSKMGGEYMAAPRTTAQILAAEAFREEFLKLRMAFVESVQSILELAVPEQIGDLMSKSVAEFSSKASEMSARLEYGKRSELGGIIVEMSDALKDRAAMKRDEFVSAIEKLEKFDFVDGHAGTGGAPSDDLTTNQEEDSHMSTTKKDAPAALTLSAALEKMDPEARKLVEAELSAAKPVVDETNKKLLAAIEAMQAEIAKLREEKSDEEFVTKARKISIPGAKIQEVADVLKTAYGLSKESGEKMERILLAQAAQSNLAAKVLKQYGQATGARSDSAGTAHEQLLAKADDIRKSEPKFTIHQAYAKAMRDNRALATAAIDNADA
jgi:hypothetical protein